MREFFGVYLLVSLKQRASGGAIGKTYIGFTVNPQRRIRQHNGDIVNGAKKTSRHRPWEMVLVCYGFPTQREALQFEWAWQHPTVSKAVRDAAAQLPKRGLSGVKGKVRLLTEMLNLEKWRGMPLTLQLLSSTALQHLAGCPPLPPNMSLTVAPLEAVPRTCADDFDLDDPAGEMCDSQSNSDAFATASAPLDALEDTAMSISPGTRKKRISKPRERGKSRAVAVSAAAAAAAGPAGSDAPLADRMPKRRGRPPLARRLSGEWDGIATPAADALHPADATFADAAASRMPAEVSARTCGGSAGAASGTADAAAAPQPKRRGRPRKVAAAPQPLDLSVNQKSAATSRTAPPPSGPRRATLQTQLAMQSADATIVISSDSEGSAASQPQASTPGRPAYQYSNPLALTSSALQESPVSQHSIPLCSPMSAYDDYSDISPLTCSPAERAVSPLRDSPASDQPGHMMVPVCHIDLEDSPVKAGAAPGLASRFEDPQTSAANLPAAMAASSKLQSLREDTQLTDRPHPSAAMCSGLNSRLLWQSPLSSSGPRRTSWPDGSLPAVAPTQQPDRGPLNVGGCDMSGDQLGAPEPASMFSPVARFAGTPRTPSAGDREGSPMQLGTVEKPHQRRRSAAQTASVIDLVTPG